MILQNLTIENFRRFNQLAIDFDQRLTVIVAKNDQGKSTVLDACAIALGTYIGAFDLGKAKHIDIKDARYQKQPNRAEGEQIFPVTIDASSSINVPPKV